MGMIMAELNFTPKVQHYVENRSIIFGVLSSVLIFMGFICNSFPEAHADWASWSRRIVEGLRTGKLSVI
jgi:hypothetical protein